MIGFNDIIKLFSREGRKFYFFIVRTAGYWPHNSNIFRSAFIHRSLNSKARLGIKGYAHLPEVDNERLEYLGDAVIEAVVSDILYHRFPKADEGFMSRIRSNMVCRARLNEVAFSLGLDKHIQLNSRKELKVSHIPGDAVEAFVAAIYLDGGYAKAFKFVKRHIASQQRIDEALSDAKVVNYKSDLLSLGEQIGLNFYFETLRDLSEPKTPLFVSHLRVADMVVAEGKAGSKKAAEQAAAQLAFDDINSGKLDTQALLNKQEELLIPKAQEAKQTQEPQVPQELQEPKEHQESQASQTPQEPEVSPEDSDSQVSIVPQLPEPLQPEDHLSDLDTNSITISEESPAESPAEPIADSELPEVQATQDPITTQIIEESQLSQIPQEAQEPIESQVLHDLQEPQESQNIQEVQNSNALEESPIASEPSPIESQEVNALQEVNTRQEGNGSQNIEVPQSYQTSPEIESFSLSDPDTLLTQYIQFKQSMDEQYKEIHRRIEYENQLLREQSLASFEHHKTECEKIFQETIKLKNDLDELRTQLQEFRKS